MARSRGTTGLRKLATAAGRAAGKARQSAGLRPAAGATARTPASSPVAESPRRRYGDACGAAHGLELVGERWALLVMRELMFGPRRFGDLRAALPGISANVLVQRLEGLEASGVVRRERLPPPASVQVYALTEWGLEASPILEALGRWAARSPVHDPTLPISAVSLMLSLRTMLDVEQARDVDLKVGFVLDRDVFLATLAKGTLSIARGPADGAEAAFAGRPEAVAAAIHGKLPLADLEDAGDLVVSGTRAAAELFVTLFKLPPKAAPRAAPGS